MRERNMPCRKKKNDILVMQKCQQELSTSGKLRIIHLLPPSTVYREPEQKTLQRQ